MRMKILWACLGVAALAMAVLAKNAMDALHSYEIREPSWSQLRTAIADWPVRIEAVGRPLKLKVNPGLTGNWLAVDMEFRNEQEADRWLKSLEVCNSPDQDSCVWPRLPDGDEQPLQGRIGKMRSRVDGEAWPWHLRVSARRADSRTLLRLEAVQPYN